MESAFGVEHGEISKSGLGMGIRLAGGAALGGGTAAAGTYAQGRTGRLNRVQSKKMGRASGGVAGGMVGGIAGGLPGMAAGAVAGGLAGGHFAHKGAVKRINNNAARKLA